MVYPICVERLIKEFNAKCPEDGTEACAQLLRLVFDMANDAYKRGRADEANQRIIGR